MRGLLILRLRERGMEIHFGRKKLNVEVRKLGFFGKIRGLMFRSNGSESLLFGEAGAIHSLFVFFPFLAVWLDGENRVVASEVVKPFTMRVLPKKRSTKLVEIPINERNREIVEFLVGGKKV